jgi:mannose-6-phosphate isomerase-like protein (cupin superfamily)
MNAFELADLLASRQKLGRAYLEFLRVPALSAGIYFLPAGGTDLQKPHAEDEVYFVVSGHATFRAGAEDRPVKPGSLLFVAADVEHRFHSIEEDLTVLVSFAPAETT